MVALTGWGMAEDRSRTREAGFDHHVVKPVTSESLLDILRDSSEESRVRGRISEG